MGAELELPAHLSSYLLLAALPLLLAACTAFTKIAVVLAALRTGLGADRLLPLGSMLALGLVLTALIMAPVAEACVGELASIGGLGALQGAPLERGAEVLAPLWEFLTVHADPKEVELFAGLSGRGGDQPLVLVPAFLISELGQGLELALKLLLPFVVVDLICAQVLVLLGVSNTPSAVVSLPAKLLLFLAADGWQLVVVALFEGYR